MSEQQPTTPGPTPAAPVMPQRDQAPGSQATPERVEVGGEGGPRIWRDREPLTTEWDPPTWWDTISGRTKAIAAGVLALVVGLALWSFKGFEDDPGSIAMVPAGAVMNSGPIELRADHAQWKWMSSGNEWWVTVMGTCRTSLSEDELPKGYQFSDALALAVPRHEGLAEGVVGEGTNAAFGEHGYGFGVARKSLTPGADWTPCSVMAKFPGSMKPSSVVRLYVFQMTLQTSDDVQTGGRGWKTDISRGVSVEVPAYQIPKQE